MNAGDTRELSDPRTLTGTVLGSLLLLLDSHNGSLHLSPEYGREGRLGYLCVVIDVLDPGEKVYRGASPDECLALAARDLHQRSHPRT